MDLRWFLVVLTCAITGITVALLWTFEVTLYYGTIPPATILVIVYLILPLIFRHNKAVQRHFVYQHNNKRHVPDTDLADPASLGVVGCRNIYLTLKENHFIGVWHIVPQNLIKHAHGKKHTDAFWTNSLKSSDKHIVLYFHGNTGTRALDHRKELYWLLQAQGYHVIAFDYRGFGDSSRVDLNEETTVEDGMHVYAWLTNMLSEGQNESAHNRIVIWGHSLGTAIASSTIARLTIVNRTPAAAILESPFTNIGEAMLHHKKTTLYKGLGHFHRLFTDALNKNNIFYKTDLNIITFHKVPVLILHACDDETVPINLGLKLAQIANQGRSSLSDDHKPVYVTEFGHGHGHKYICRFPGLLQAIDNFIASASPSYK